MTDAAVAITIAPAGDVVAIECWDGDPGDVRQGKLVKVEPRRWWLIDGRSEAGELAERLRERGVTAAIGGGLTRARLSGPGWRSLLMVGGLFDFEHPDLAPGSVASTVLHHVPVRVIVDSAEACSVYFPASYSEAVAHHWTSTTEASSIEWGRVG